MVTCCHQGPGVGGGVGRQVQGQTKPVTPELPSPGYEEVVWIPKGSVHIFIQDLNLSLSHLGEPEVGE